MFLDADLQIPNWVSCRTYSSSSGAMMSIISNQVTHEIMVLKDESSYIWSLFEAAVYKSDNALIYLKNQLSEDPVADLNQFIKSLVHAKFLSVSGETYFLPPEPTPLPEQFSLSSIGPTVSEEDKALEDEVAWFAEENGYLFSGFWEATNRCNEKCIHCFNPGASHAPSEKPQRKTAELSTSEGKQLVRQFYDAGAYRLIISGGEIFLRRDIFDIIAYARSLHMQVHIFTNGLLLDHDKISKLAGFYPESVSISIYSANPQIHDEITKVRGSFQKSVEALRLLNELGIKTTVKSIQMAHTVQGYKLVEELAQKLGARVTTELNMSAGNDGAQAPIDLAVSDDRELLALAVLPGSPIFVGGESERYSERRRQPTETFCSAGQSMLSVTSDGNITPCVALPLIVGNTRNQSLSDLWKQSSVGQRGDADIAKRNDVAGDILSDWQSIRVQDYAECGTHERCGWCNKCPGMSLNETGNVLASSVVQCRIAHARMTGAKRLAAGQTTEIVLADLKLPTNFGSDPEKRELPDLKVSFVAQKAFQRP
jgi:MoaA/NifB/PqqE/SkfB family radical SAM enzyme